ncbi:uncharacterized protein LOC127131247 [Lathyrus oleraceus]|uniref:uncharacterized protein LOC127131247 n=1 Tax=Pisum sativum TaxID=3888 RepID=UPI0021D042C6|nr:uncharacterized protein LOC127131247 [Pisum sativum]
MTNVDGVVVPKSEAQWTADDEKKWSHDWKARNILISSLGVNDYYRVFHCTTAKAMWDSLQFAYEGTNEVKQARRNILNQDFELFHMKHGETISDMQKSHLVNHLNALGNGNRRSPQSRKLIIS